MNSAFANIMSMIVGNPITGIPGLVGVCATIGPAVAALGEALVRLGAGDNFWTVVINFVRNEDVSTLAVSTGLIFSKDFNRTGGTLKV